MGQAEDTEMRFHAVLIDECGDEFGADINAKDENEAWEKFQENYPESRVIQVESPADARRRERDLMLAVQAEDY